MDILSYFTDISDELLIANQGSSGDKNIGKKYEVLPKGSDLFDPIILQIGSGQLALQLSFGSI